MVDLVDCLNKILYFYILSTSLSKFTVFYNIIAVNLIRNKIYIKKLFYWINVNLKSCFKMLFLGNTNICQSFF